ncbi:enoyl-CoA hydratase/isomerase family protein [Arthrobacter sp. BHU FT2]|nr:enoyl-CoA hydratase/isomerase family protein [Arthrobacter sp. BHU FT2]
MTAGSETPSGALRLEKAGAVATIVIENKGRRNAVSKAMWQQFAPLISRLEADDAVKVIVVRGAGEDFSAGADISDLKAILHDQETDQHDGGHVSAGEKALATCSKPTVAAIDGYCLGGAWQIAGACDIRLASDRATFGITPSKIGIVYPLSGIERLVRLVGPATAKYLLFSGDFIDAATAQQLGLVVQVIPRQDFWDNVYEFAQRLCTRSQLSIHAMKEIVDIIADSGTNLAQCSLYWQEEMSVSGEATNGITAFLAKEKPAFSWSRKELISTRPEVPAAAQ